jgi:hypothetical protein
MVHVRLPDRSTRGVPAWMFDPGICAGIRWSENPLIDVSALVQLSRMLDSTSPGERNMGHEPTTIRKQESEANSKA